MSSHHNYSIGSPQKGASLISSVRISIRRKGLNDDYETLELAMNEELTDDFLGIDSQSTKKVNEAKRGIGSLKALFLACRPRTLPVSLPPIILGTALARLQVDHLNWVVIVFALLCSLAIQIGTNLVNDALDFKKGADGQGRLGPLRVTQSGFLSFNQVMTAGCLFFIFALLCGIPLIFAGGWPLGLIITLSVACGYLYTGGPWPLAYTGISDFFVLLFFGWVSTGTVYYLLTGRVDFLCFLAATQIGLLAIVPHAINNLRDHLSDARVDKKTLAVRFGPDFARWEITMLSMIPFFLGLLWIKEGFVWMTVLPLSVLPLVIGNLKGIWKTEPSSIYNEFLARSALCELIFGCLLAAGTFLS
jgi:1,4-dihydroxy-2-naphthoate polyprenyltransferase